MQKPDVDEIEGLSPAISIDQKSRSNNPRSTVATTGAIGVGLYVVFLGVVISQIIILFKKSNDLSQEEELLLLSSFAGFISLIVTNFFGFSITVTNLYLYILPACVVAIIAKKKFEKDREKVPPISKQQKRMLAGIGVVMVIVVFYVLQYFYADVKYALGDNLANVQDYNGSLTNLYAAYSLRNEHVYADKISNVLAQVTLLQAATKGDMHCVSHKNELKPCTELVASMALVAVSTSVEVSQEHLEELQDQLAMSFLL
jgi:hypothetical protein